MAMLSMPFLAGISVIIGFLGSLTGLGGASILIPLLTLLGVPVKEAIASSMVAIIATSSGSASAYVKQRIANVKIAMYLEMFTITGAIVGAIITTILNPVYLYFFFAAFLMLTFLRFRKSSPAAIQPINQDKFSRWLEFHGSYYDRSTGQTVEYQSRNAALGGAGMLVAGLAAGMLGIGAGAFKVMIHENVLHMPTKVSSATSNFIIGMTALAGVSVYLFSGLLNVTLMAPMAIGTTIGALIGGRFMNRINDKWLRMLFIVIVVYLIVQMLYKGIASI